MANRLSHICPVVGSLWLSQLTKNTGIVIQRTSTLVVQQSCFNLYSRTCNHNKGTHLDYQLHPRRPFHTGQIQMSRIKWRYTHKPFFHTKKTAKAEGAPLTASNRAFLEKVLQDTYNEEKFGDRYAYVAPPKTKAHDENNIEQRKVSPLIAELEPWTRGTWEECGVKTTRVGLIGRKIGVVPMWLKNGKPVLATMLHVEDNHVVKYIAADEFSKTVVAQRMIRPYIMKPTASISRGNLVVGALSADPSKFTKDYCGLFTGSGVMPKKKLVRFPGA